MRLLARLLQIAFKLAGVALLVIPIAAGDAVTNWLLILAPFAWAIGVAIDPDDDSSSRQHNREPDEER